MTRTAQPSDIVDALGRPVVRKTRAQKMIGLLGGETTAYTGLTLGDLIYDWARVDGEAVKAFDFARAIDLTDIYNLARFAEDTLSKTGTAYQGAVNNLQGYVFERMAAAMLM